MSQPDDQSDPRGGLPDVGSLWVWEPDSAPALIKVTKVEWNGEEWWVATLTLADYTLPEAVRTTGRELWNELGRFWEACHYVAPQPGPR